MKTRLLGTVSACAVTLLSLSAQAVPVSGQGTWESTLQGRDLDGNASTYEAYYDTTLKITWLADANFAQTSGFDSDGQMNWVDANAWAAGLTLGGYTDWRLPTITPINGSSYNTTLSTNATTDFGYADSAGWLDGSGNPVSEMGHMYYVALGNLGACAPNNANPGSCPAKQPGYGLSNTADFLNLQANGYWSGSVLDSSNAWANFFGGGGQFSGIDSNLKFAWAVRSGDVSAVPVPAAVWLFGSGLIGLLGLARRKQGFLCRI